MKNVQKYVPLIFKKCGEFCCVNQIDEGVSLRHTLILL